MFENINPKIGLFAAAASLFLAGIVVAQQVTVTKLNKKIQYKDNQIDANTRSYKLALNRIHGKEMIELAKETIADTTFNHIVKHII